MKFDNFIKDIESNNQINSVKLDKSKFTDEDMLMYGLLKGRDGKCLMCDDNTKYIDYCSEAHMCSKNCMKKFYEKVMENEQKY